MFRLSLQTKDSATSPTTGTSNATSTTTQTLRELTFVDLSGYVAAFPEPIISLFAFSHDMLQRNTIHRSEWAKDQAAHSAERREETKQINASLYALKRCLRFKLLRGLHPDKKALPTPPMRESLITRILTPVFLQPAARLVLLSCVSPSSADVDHSMVCDKHVCVDFRQPEGVFHNFRWFCRPLLFIVAFRLPVHKIVQPQRNIRFPVKRSVVHGAPVNSCALSSLVNVMTEFVGPHDEC